MTLAAAACLLPVYYNIGHYMFALFLENWPTMQDGSALHIYSSSSSFKRTG